MLPIVKFWYNYNLPPFFTSVSTITGWGTELSGKFYAEKAGSYRFYFGGEGSFKFIFNGTTRISDQRINLDDQNYSSANVTGLSAATWYDINIRYWNPITYGARSGFTALWRHSASSTSMPQAIPISAGVTNLTANFLTSYQINDVIATQWEKQPKQAAIFEFKIPLVSSADTIRGFKREIASSGDRYYKDISNSNIKLKKFKMIEYKEGFRNFNGADQLVTKFVGHIRDIQIELNSEGNDILTIKCIDPTIFTRDQFNIDAPNPIDYISSGYITNVPGHVSGLAKPPAYDGWSLYRVFQSLLVNSFIDPTLFIKRKTLLDIDNLQVQGDYLIEELNRLSSLIIWLTRNLKYGQPYAISEDDADDKYLFPLNFGEYYQDMINKIVDEYALIWGFNNEGNIYLKAVDIPNRFVDDRSTAWSYTGTWISSTAGASVSPLSAIQATYKVSASSADSVQGTFKGSRFDLIVAVGPKASSSDFSKKSIRVKINDKYTNQISSASYNIYNTSNRLYYDGIDPNLGYNPCILNIGKGLKYDTYTVNIKKIKNKDNTRIDSLLVYDSDVNSPVESFKTGDNNSIPGTITELSGEETTEDFRNQAVVLGALQGSKIGNISGDEGIVNPNNPIFSYVSSNTIDLNSIYSHTASNFVGRPLQVVVFEPSINTQEQADFLSFNIVNQYRKAGDKPTFETLGHPLLEEFDPIYVTDEFKQTFDSSKTYYINGIASKFDQSGYFTRFNITEVKTLPSYLSRPAVDLSQFDNKPLINLGITNKGTILTNIKFFSGGATALVVNSTANVIKPSGYLYIRKNDRVSFDASNWGTYGIRFHELPISPLDFDPPPAIGIHEEIMSYTKITGSTIHGIQRSLQGSDNVSLNSGSAIINYFDPYTTEDRGIYPQISFTLLERGYIDIKAYAISDDLDIPVFIDTINAPASQDVHEENIWEFHEWGSSKSKIWGGIERSGFWNQRNSDWLDNIGKGFYVSEEIFPEQWYYLWEKQPRTYKIHRWGFHQLRSEYQPIQFKIKFRSYDTLEIKESTTVPGVLVYRRGNIRNPVLAINHASSISYWKDNSIEDPLNQQIVLESAISFPDYETDYGKAKSMNFFRSQSNGNRGLKINIKVENPDYFNGKDLANFRSYRLNLIAHAWVAVAMRWDGIVFLWDVYPYKWDIEKDTSIKWPLDKLQEGIDFYFHPENDSNKLQDDYKEGGYPFAYIPQKWLTEFQTQLSPYDNRVKIWDVIDRVGFWWVFYFEANIVDKSGRKIWNNKSYLSPFGSYNPEARYGYGIFRGTNPMAPGVPHYWPSLHDGMNIDNYMNNRPIMPGHQAKRSELGAVYYKDNNNNWNSYTIGHTAGSNLSLPQGNGVNTLDYIGWVKTTDSSLNTPVRIPNQIRVYQDEVQNLPLIRPKLQNFPYNQMPYLMLVKKEDVGAFSGY